MLFRTCPFRTEDSRVISGRKIFLNCFVVPPRTLLIEVIHLLQGYVLSLRVPVTSSSGITLRPL